MDENDEAAYLAARTAEALQQATHDMLTATRLQQVMEILAGTLGYISTMIDNQALAHRNHSLVGANLRKFQHVVRAWIPERVDN